MFNHNYVVPVTRAVSGTTAGLLVFIFYALMTL